MLISVGERLHQVAFFLSDGVIVTGNATGEEASLEEVDQVRAAVKLPLLQHPEPVAGPGAEIDVLGHRQLGRQRQFLVDQKDSLLACIERTLAARERA